MIEVTLKHGRVTQIDGAESYPCQVCGKALRVGDFAILDGTHNGTRVSCSIPIPGHKAGAQRLCRPFENRTHEPRPDDTRS